MIHRKIAVFVFAFLLVPSFVLAQRPNVILIMADDLGMESIGCYGGTSFETPTFDRLAREGMKFNNCFSQPLCTPSRNKIMTGRSNARNYSGFGHLDKNEITFGTIMKHAGYKTAIAGKWQLTGGGGGTGTKDGTGSYPDDCGFDETCMWAYDRDVTKVQSEAYYAPFPEGVKQKMSRFWYPGILKNGKLMETGENDFGPDIYTNFLLDFIEKNHDQPFFVYYPMALTHNPFVPMPTTEGVEEFSLQQKLQGDIKYFPDMVRYSATIIDRFRKKLDELDIAENTLVVFTSDNGNYRSLEYQMSGRTVIGGKGLPLDAGCRAPTLAWWKGKIQPGSQCDDLIDFTDFVPTVAEAGRAPLPGDRAIDGQSFLSVLQGESYTGKTYIPRSAVFVHYDKNPDSAEPDFHRIRFAHDGRYKLYLDGNLFDASTDFEEEHPIDVANASAEVAVARQNLQQMLDRMPDWSPDNSFFNGQPDPQTLERRERLKQIRAQEQDD